MNLNLQPIGIRTSLCDYKNKMKIANKLQCSSFIQKCLYAFCSYTKASDVPESVTWISSGYAVGWSVEFFFWSDITGQVTKGQALF